MFWPSKRWPPPLDWIQVEVTSRCQAACTYCPHTAWRKEWLHGDLDRRIFDAVLSQVRAGTMVHLQGWGEPLLHPGLVDFVGAARARGCLPTTTTNAVELDVERTLRLAEAGLEILGVSVAGVDPHINDRLRCGTSARRIVTVLETVAAELARRGLDRPRLHVAYMLTRLGRDHFPEAVRVLGRAGARKIVASSLDLVVDEALAGELLLDADPGEAASLRDVLAEAASAAREVDVELMVQLATARKPGACPERPDRSLFVGFDGLVFPCVYTGVPLSRPVRHWLPDGWARLERMPFGWVTEQGLGEIWRQASMRDFRKAASNPRRRSGRCLTCLKPRVEAWNPARDDGGSFPLPFQ